MRGRQRAFEQLEARYALSTLVVEGTAGNDVIEVRPHDGSYDQVMVEVNGVVTGPFQPDGDIIVRAGAGDDSVTIDAGVVIGVDIDGGIGSDTLRGGSGDDLFRTRDDQTDFIFGGLGINSAMTDSEDRPANIQHINPVPFDESNSPIRLRVMVVNYEPRIPSEGDKRLWEVFNWEDPRSQAKQNEETIERVSGGSVDIDITHWKDLDAFPHFTDGFVYTPDQYVQNRRTNTGWHTGQIDFPRMVEELNIVELIDSGEVDEVWFFGDHFFIPVIGESWMAGPGAFFINGPTFPQIPSQRAFASMGFNYERGLSMMLHNLGHRTEATMNRTYGPWNLANPTNNWELFSANNVQSNGVAGVGTTHWPPNAQHDYDTFNTRFVESWADDFLNYPTLTGATKLVNRDTWGQGRTNDFEGDYQKWYFSRLPRANGINPDGKQNNWWKYIMDFNHYTQNGQPLDLSASAISDDVYVEGGTSYQFQVAYSGAVAVDLATLGGDDVVIRGPAGQVLPARLTQTSSQRTSNYQVATYELLPPGGSWDVADRGLYRIELVAGTVADLAGNAMAGATIGAFRMRGEQATEVDHGANELLTLRFNQSLVGVDGESPISSNSVAFTPGVVGSGLDVDDGGRVVYAQAGNISPAEGSIQFWFRPDWTPNGQGHVLFQVGDTFNNSFYGLIDGANNLRFIVWGDNPSTPAVESNYERGLAYNVNHWTAGEFHHYAVNWNQATQSMQMFVDGQLIGTELLPGMSSFSRSDLVIGAAYDGGAPSRSTFDEFQISARAVSPGEVQANYRAAASINALQLVLPDSIEVGLGAQAKAVATTTFGRSIDVTDQVQWRSSVSQIGSINSVGQLVGQAAGQTIISAQLGSLTQSVGLQVTPVQTPRIESVVVSGLSQEFFSVEEEFTVTFNAAVPVASDSLGLGDFRVWGPHGFSQFPRLKSWSAGTTPGTMVATYTVSAPGGYWDGSDNGQYWIESKSEQVHSLDNRYLIGNDRLASWTVSQTPDNTAPTAYSQSVSLAENSAADTLVATMLADDPDEGDAGRIVWSIIGGNADGALRIDSSTGQIRVVNPTAFNFEVASSRELIIRASDQGQPALFGDCTLSITITDVNEPPLLTSIGPFTVAENGAIGTVLGTVTAGDPDAGQRLTYRVGSSGSSLVAIHPTSGQMTLAGNVDFEDTAQLQVEIIVSDNGQPSLQTSGMVTINVTNVNEPPVIIDVPEFSVPEDATVGTILGRIQARDPDAGQTVLYSLSGVNANRFRIDANSGIVSVRSALDFELMGRIELLVTVEENGGQRLQASAPVFIQVTDVNEPPVINAPTSLSIAENSPTGTIIAQLTASDPDAGTAGQIVWSIVGGNAGDAFGIDASDGYLQVAEPRALNFELASSQELVVRATDQGQPSLSSDRTLTITVTDVNEPPIFASTGPFTVAENPASGTVVGSVTAIDPDRGQSVSYRLADDGGGAVTIDATTGQLKVLNSALFDFENLVAPFRIEVVASDNGQPALQVSSMVEVHVTDVDESPIVHSVPEITLPEDVEIGMVVGRIEALDPEGLHSLVFTLSGVHADRFLIDQASGILSVRSALDFESMGSTQLLVTVEENGGQRLQTTVPFVMQITDVNEPPFFSSPTSFEVAENRPAGFIMGRLAASDPDAGLAGQIVWSIIAGNLGGEFEILADSGYLRVINPSALNFEAASSRELVVRAADRGQPSLSTDQTVTVVVTDVNEPPLFESTGPFAVAENSPVGTVLGNVSAVDPDRGQTLSYRLTSDAGGAVAIDATSGQLTVSNSALLDFESLRRIQIEVLATDTGNPEISTAASVMINVIDRNDAPQVQSALPPQLAEVGMAYQFQFAEDLFFDQDAGDELTYRLEAKGGDAFPDWLQFHPDSRTLSGTPNAGDEGELLLELIATDRAGATAITELRLEVSANAYPWHYAPRPLDVNRDEVISPLDILLIVNYLNRSGSGFVPPGAPPTHGYIDTSRDNAVSALDVLLIVNELNRQSEGELAIETFAVDWIDQELHDRKRMKKNWTGNRG